MRVPRPPAITTTATIASSAHQLDGWGARIRTWDRGTKTRCLTTWLRPTTSIVPQVFFADLSGFGFSPTTRISAITAKIPARISVSGPSSGRDHTEDDRERLRGSGDPRDLTAGVGFQIPAGEDVEQDDRDRDRDHRPARDVVRKGDEDPLDDRDSERDLQPPLVEPSPLLRRGSAWLGLGESRARPESRSPAQPTTLAERSRPGPGARPGQRPPPPQPRPRTARRRPGRRR